MMDCHLFSQLLGSVALPLKTTCAEMVLGPTQSPYEGDR